MSRGLNFVLFVSTSKVGYKIANIRAEYFLLKPIYKGHKRKWNELILHGRYPFGHACVEIFPIGNLI